MKLVRIDWLDAASTRGWGPPQVDNGLVMIYSVGWLAEETKDFYALSTSRSQHNRVIDTLSIPKKMVKGIRILGGK